MSRKPFVCELILSVAVSSWLSCVQIAAESLMPSIKNYPTLLLS